jgi:uncharacterized membrane protein YjjP (DUF1212 family)
MRFVAGLGAAMASTNYPVTMVRNYAQMGTSSGDGRTYISHPDEDLSFDQTFPLATLIARAQTGVITPVEGSAELDRIWGMAPRFSAWVGVIGYTLQSAGLSLILQPSPLTLVLPLALGTVVGVLCEVARHNDALQQLLPTVCAFTVSPAAFAAVDELHLPDASLRALAPPLAIFLPGAAITLAVAELSTRQIVSGSSRLASRLMRIAQLAFGILMAAQVAGISESNLVVTHVNRPRAWAPWAGIVVYGVGAFLCGFGGGLVLTLCALAVAQRPNTPAAISLILPGFWLLVPGSLGLMGVTQLLGTDNTTVLTATLISMISIALGMQTGLLVWRAAVQLTSER